MGQSIGVTDNCYTSQLHITVAADMNNETINCDHRPGTEINNIGQSTLVVMTGKYCTLSITYTCTWYVGQLCTCLSRKYMSYLQ